MITEVYRRTVAQAVTAAVAETEAKFKAEAETKAKEAETKAKEAETKAALQTRRTDLTKLLEHKFPKKSDQAAPHIEVADDPELLAEWFNHALSAESWKEFAKAVGWRGVNGHHNGNGNGNGHGKENGV